MRGFSFTYFFVSDIIGYMTVKNKKVTIEDLAVMVKKGFDEIRSEMGTKKDLNELRVELKCDIKELGEQLNHRMEGVELKISSYASSWEREHSQLHDWVTELDKRVNKLEDKVTK